MAQRAGRRDRRIIIESGTATQGADGTEVTVWATFDTVWAELIPQRGGESFSNDQREARQDVQFKVLKRTGITPKMRISYNGAFYNIRDVGDPSRSEILLTCDAPEVQS